MSGRDAIAARREDVARMTRLGMTASEIAALFNITGRTVTRDRVALGIAQPGPKYITPDQWATVERLLADGASINEAARTVGTNSSTICRKFKGRGWTKREGGQFRAATRAAERALQAIS